MLNPTEITAMDATEMGRRIADGQIRSEELIDAHLRLIEERNPAINAFALSRPEKALAQARAMDRDLGEAKRRSAFHGVPFTVKDSIDTADWRTARGSRTFESRVPTSNATAVSRMLEAGAVLIGKTNLPEFSFWTETDNDLTGRTNNPFDLERTPGGSSGGESAAIAAGMSPMGLGSDVAISVRGPAHCTGIAALKPSRSRTPLTGHWPSVPAEQWHVGPMARSIRDLKTMLDVIQGSDGSDPHATAPRHARRELPRLLTATIGWTSAPAFGPVSPDVARVLERAAQSLSEQTRVRQTSMLDPLADLDCTSVSAVLLSSQVIPLFREYGRSTHLLSARIRQLVNSDLPSDAEVGAARTLTDKLKLIIDDFFVHHDVLLCPVCPTTAPLHDQQRLQIRDVSAAARAVMRATVPFNLTGHPAVSVPFGWADDGLPINVQVVGRPGDDETALAVAKFLERQRGQP